MVTHKVRRLPIAAVRSRCSAASARGSTSTTRSSTRRRASLPGGSPRARCAQPGSRLRTTARPRMSCSPPDSAGSSMRFTRGASPQSRGISRVRPTRAACGARGRCCRSGRHGGAFDGVALDIEALREKNVPRRTSRMLDLLTRLRAESGSVPVAAITYPPRAFERHLSWWPGFPWGEIASPWTPLDGNAVHGRLPGLRRDHGYVHARCAAPERRWRLDPGARGRGVASRMTAETPSVQRRGARQRVRLRMEPLRLRHDDARGLVGDSAAQRGCRLRKSRRRAEAGTKFTRAHRAAGRASRCSGITFTSARTGMKFVSPAQRGTTCSCR